MKETLNEKAQGRELHRSFIMPLAGFSFTGLIAIIILDSASKYKYVVYYLFISFICYLSSLHYQGYKSKRWHDQVATAFIDAGSLSLILSFIAIIGHQPYGVTFSLSLSILAVTSWLIHHTLFIRKEWEALSAKKGGITNEQ